MDNNLEEQKIKGSEMNSLDSIVDQHPNIKERKDLHLMRKFFHSLPGLSLIFLLHEKIFPTYLVITGLGFLFVLVTFFEIIRIRYRQVNNFALIFSKKIIRKDELQEFSGIPWYLAGCFLSLILFHPDVAKLGILYLALGDPFASFMGILYGDGSQKIYKDKTLVGFVAMLCMCIMIGLVYGTVSQWDQSLIGSVALFGGLAGAFSELLAPKEFNDNALIPLVAGGVLTLVLSKFFIM